MARSEKTSKASIEHVSIQIGSSADSLFAARDFKGHGHSSASRQLAQLANQGVLIRAARGLYYLPKDTLLGKSRPTQLAVFERIWAGKYRPTLTSAAYILGLTTQIPARPQFVLYASRLPSNFGDIQITLRSGKRPRPLPKLEGALIEFLRDRGACAEADPQETCIRLQEVIKEYMSGKALSLLCEVALTEPAKVRAILGALLEWSETDRILWERLRSSLNPRSRFDFGHFSQMENCQRWQIKLAEIPETSSA